MAKLSLLKFGKKEDENQPPAAAAAQAETTTTLGPAVDTKEINTLSLRQQLNGLKTKLGILVPKFDRTTGFMPLFATLAMWVHEVWSRFESTGCKVLNETANELSRGIREFNPGYLLGQYTLALQAAEKRLVERLYTIIKARHDREQERLAKLAQVTADLPVLKDSLWCYGITMTGDPDAVIERVHYALHYLTAFLLFCALCAVEGMAGYGMFEFAGSSYSALAWSLITVIILDVTAHLGGTARAIINGHKDALRNYRQKCGGGVNDINGNPVYVAPLGSSIYTRSRSCGAILLLWSLGLVAFRITLATSDPNLGWSAVFGSVGMAVLAAVYYFAQISYAPQHSKKQVTQYFRREAEVKGAEHLMVQLSAPPADDPSAVEREQAINGYNEVANQAAAVVINDCAYRRNLAGLYIALTEQYKAAYNLARTLFYNLVRELGNLVPKSPDVDVHEFEHAERTAQITQLFNGQVVLTLDNPELLAKAVEFNPNVDLSAAGRLNDFGPLETQALAKVQGEHVQSGGTGNMIFNFGERKIQ